VGKLVGIVAFSWAAVRLGWARKPNDITWQQVAAVALLGGIGFTVSLFFTQLAFSEPGRSRRPRSASLRRL
jgi:NhaA family Na+:H+ antiporter